MKKCTRLTAILCSAMLALGASFTAFAADTAPVSAPARPGSIDFNASYVDVITVIDRDLHASYRVTGAEDRAAILNALNKIEYRPGTNVVPDNDGLRLLQLRFQNGGTYEYWCHRNVLMNGETQLTDGLASADLYKALDRAQKFYPANIEWIGFMNPYRVTRIDLQSVNGAAAYQSALSPTQREAILDMTAKLKSVQVAKFRELAGSADLTVSEDAKLLYDLKLDFENGKEGYRVCVFDNGRINVKVDSINYALSYASGDQTKFNELTTALKKYAR